MGFSRMSKDELMDEWEEPQPEEPLKFLSLQKEKRKLKFLF